jgi:hypothetical protein
MQCILRNDLDQRESKAKDNSERQNHGNHIWERMFRNADSANHPAHDVDQVNGDDRHDQWHEKVLSDAQDIKGRDYNPKGQRDRNKPALITETGGALISRIHQAIQGVSFPSIRPFHELFLVSVNLGDQTQNYNRKRN